MPANANISPIQQSGSANVPLGESTGSQYQAAPYSETTTVSGYQSITDEVNAIETASVFVTLGVSGGNVGGAMLQGTAPGVNAVIAGSGGFIAGASVSGIIPTGLVVQGVVQQSGIGASGYPGQQASIWASGLSASFIAATSGPYGPAGYFAVQVLGISGNPYMKIPFFNS